MVDESEILLTIIIPYFKTYELTYKLLKSIELQHNGYVEVILIDDGCNEKQFDIKEFTKWIHIIHQENIGVAKTRNKGIGIAKGRYIAFIDSDDQITSDYIEILLNAINKYDTDIINFNWVDLTENIVARKPHNPAPWKQIYKKDIIPKFREDLPYGREDVDFQVEIDRGLTTGKFSVTYLDRVLYLYNSNREGSLYWLSKHEGGD